MKPMDMKMISAGILFVLIILSGVWVTRSGRPLNVAIFTVHKLIALACLVLLVIIVKTLIKGVPVNPSIIISIVLTALFFITMFATGAILSFEKPAPKFVLLLHQVVPALTLFSSVITIYFLKK
jgi:hypothetical protein